MKHVLEHLYFSVRRVLTISSILVEMEEALYARVLLFLQATISLATYRGCGAEGGAAEA